MLDQRGQLLRAAVGFAGCSMLSYDRALHALSTWLDSWAGIGHVAVGMLRQGYDLQLTQYDDRGWRATFYTTGMEHSPTSATGTGWERTPMRARTVGARVIVDRNYRGCRIEVEAKLANGLWDAHVRIFRAPSELVHVETIICQQPTAAIAEEGSVIRARRWVDGQSGRSLPKTPLASRVAWVVASLYGVRLVL